MNITVTGPGGPYTFNNVLVTNGLFNLTVTLNLTGNYTVRAVYGGNLTYGNSSSRGAGYDGNIVITAMTSNATVNNPNTRATESVNINGTLRDPSGVPITGTVTVTITGPGGSYNYTVSVVNGQYNFNVTMNVSGSYNIVVNYPGDSTYGPSTANGILTVSLMPTHVSVNSPSGNATLPVNINGTLLDDNGNRVNGTVNITIGGTTYTVNLINGQYNLSVTLGAIGNYPILVEYFGNGTYAGSINNTGNLYIAYMSSNTVVSNASSIATVPVIINVTVKDINGNDITGLVNVTINGPGGPYVFNNVNVINGKFNLTVTMGSAGIYTVFVEYGGNGSYAGSTGTGTLNISTMASGTIVNNASSKATNPVTITGTVSSGINGTVDITINGTLYSNVPVVNGIYNLTVVWNVSGTYVIFVNYGGNATFNGSNATSWLTVELMPTNTSVTNGSGIASESTLITGTVYDENNIGINGTVNVTITGPGGSFTINGVNVTNGLYNLTVVLNLTGNYTVRAVYGGNLTYRNSSSRGAGYDGNIVITAMGSNATVNSPTTKATESVNINGTLYDPSGVPITGTVSITLNGPGGPYTFNNVSVVNGVYNLTVTMNVSGLYSIVVNYPGDTTYGPSTVNGILNVTLMPSNTTVNGINGNATVPVIINGTIVDENGVPITGSVNITINGTLYPNVPVINGLYNLTVTMGAAGNYTVVVAYGGNGTYAGSSTTGSLNIGLMSTNVSVNSPNGTATVPVIINGTLLDDNGVPINGSVNITVDGVTYNVTVVNGLYNLSVVIGSEGNYTVTVVYGGNGTYAGSTTIGTLNIGSMASGTTVNNVTAKATNSVSITGTVSSGLPVNGTVNITIDGITYVDVPVVNGVYNLTVTLNVSGNYSVVVVYGGNATFNGSNATGWLNIELMPTNTSVTNVSGIASEPTIITGTVYDENGVAITGLVNVTIACPDGSNIVLNNVSVVNGHFNVTVILNATGSYSVSVKYGGNVTYAASASRALDGLININAMTSNTTVNNVTGKATDPVIISGTVLDKDGNPINGTVDITVGGTTYYNVTVTDGNYSLVVTVNNSGLQNIVVTYHGDDTYGPSSATGLLTVVLMDSVVTIDNGFSKPGVSIVLNGTLKDANGVLITGIVHVYYGNGSVRSVNVVNGSFNVNLTFNSVGNFTITVVYNGDNVYSNSSGNGWVFVDEISTTVTVNNPTGRATEQVVITGTVTNNLGFPVNGFVTININGTSYTVQVVNGVYSLAVLYNVSDNYIVTVVYAGDAIFVGSNTSGIMTINLMPTTTVVIDAPLRTNFTSNLTADLVDDNGRAIAGATVDFYVNGIYVGSNVTDSNGRAVYEYRPSTQGFYNVDAVYNGNQTYINSNGAFTIESTKMGANFTIGPNSTKPFNNTTVVVTIIDEFGNPIPNMNVTVVIDGVEYNFTTDSEGKVTVPYWTDEAGDIPINVSFEETDLYKALNGTAILNVQKIVTSIIIDNLAITTIDKVEITATLVDEFGNPIANKMVEVFLDSVSLGMFKTDANGKILIKRDSLPLGSYSISISYAGDKAYESTVSNGILNVRLVKTTLTLNRITDYTDHKTLFVATLLDEFGNPVAYKTITFTLNGFIIGTAMTNANGRVMLSYFTYGGDFEIIAEFDEDTVYSGSWNFLNFNVDYGTNMNNTNGTDVNGTKPGNGTNGTGKPGNGTNGTGRPDNGSKPGVDPDSDGSTITLPAENEDLASSVPAGAKMLKTGNPIAILALCLLSILLIGFRKRRKKE